MAFSGLGRMGGALVHRLRDAGHSLSVYDASEEVRAAFARDGFEVRAHLREAASGAGVVMLCLPDSAAVDASVPEILAASPRPSLCIDLTSSDPEATRRVADRLSAAGIAMIDSPVSGGVAGAQAGRLTAMVGGDRDLVTASERWLRAFAGQVLWAGPLGSGDAVKAINNALSASSLTASAEMFTTGCRAGIDPLEIVTAFNASHARSQNTEVKFPDQVLTGRFGAGFTAGLMLK
ncbi:MAG: NAD(P)-dependent oxidoreductase, partial [Candidatus Dormibacteraceae bacterium]